MEIVDLSPLFYTKKKKADECNWWGENAPGLDEETCRFLSESEVKAVGAEFGHAVYFLPRSILIIEGLHDLAKVPPIFYFIALPLKIKGGSGSPIRPIALFPKV